MNGRCLVNIHIKDANAVWSWKSWMICVPLFSRHSRPWLIDIKSYPHARVACAAKNWHYQVARSLKATASKPHHDQEISEAHEQVGSECLDINFRQMKKFIVGVDGIITNRRMGEGYEKMGIDNDLIVKRLNIQSVVPYNKMRKTAISFWHCYYKVIRSQELRQNWNRNWTSAAGIHVSGSRARRPAVISGIARLKVTEPPASRASLTVARYAGGPKPSRNMTIFGKPITTIQMQKCVLDGM